MVLWLRVSPNEIKVLAGAASVLGSSEKDLHLSALVQLLMGSSFCGCWVESLSSFLAVGQRLPQFLGCGPLLRAAENMTGVFLRVRKRVKERKRVCV